MELLCKRPLPFAALCFFFASFLKPATPDLGNFPTDCEIRQRLTAERAEFRSFSFDAFLLLSAMHLRVTNANTTILIFVTTETVAILTEDFRYEEVSLSRHIPGWSSFILKITDNIQLGTRDGDGITGLLKRDLLRIDPSLDLKADISNVPLMRGCGVGGPTVSVNPVGEMNLLSVVPSSQHVFTVLGSQDFNLSLFINDHKVTSLCGKGSGNFTLNFHTSKNQDHQIIVPGVQPITFRMILNSSEGTEWMKLSFRGAGRDLFVTYSLPWKETLSLPQEPVLMNFCTGDDDMVVTSEEMPLTTSSAQLSTRSTDPEQPSSTTDSAGSLELVVLVLILIILLITVTLVIVLVVMKTKRKSSRAVNGESLAQQSTEAPSSVHLEENDDRYIKWKSNYSRDDDPSPLRTPALHEREYANGPWNALASRGLSAFFYQGSDAQVSEDPIYEEIIITDQLTLTSSRASYCNYLENGVIQENEDGYVNMAHYLRK
ncbi:uncharacterized protein LOC135207277 isoform X2 [Macrobrachium nipponense]|uniref:uncharacterized protein LOC135207277 isoform X2 n=1 Tax=Macrobrachium nipponense TaxID=159736 RepID=UPI0030C7F526